MVLALRMSSGSDAKCGYVMTCLGGWFKQPSGERTHFPTLYTQGLRVLKVATLQKSSWPFADLYITFI